MQEKIIQVCKQRYVNIGTYLVEFTLGVFLHYKILTCNCNFVLCIPVCVGICSMYGGEKRYIQGFSGETWGKEAILKT
jgi:hypothetical protein